MCSYDQVFNKIPAMNVTRDRICAHIYDAMSEDERSLFRPGDSATEIVKKLFPNNWGAIAGSKTAMKAIELMADDSQFADRISLYKSAFSTILSEEDTEGLLREIGFFVEFKNSFNHTHKMISSIIENIGERISNVKLAFDQHQQNGVLSIESQKKIFGDLHTQEYYEASIECSESNTKFAAS